MSHANISLLIKNCTFKHIKGYLDHLVFGEFSTNNVTVLFKNCSFHFNEASFLLSIEAMFYDGLCLHPSNFTIKNCEFSNKNATMLWLSNHAYDCKTNIF